MYVLNGDTRLFILVETMKGAKCSVVSQNHVWNATSTFNKNKDQNKIEGQDFLFCLENLQNKTQHLKSWLMFEYYLFFSHGIREFTVRLINQLQSKQQVTPCALLKSAFVCSSGTICRKKTSCYPEQGRGVCAVKDCVRFRWGSEDFSLIKAAASSSQLRTLLFFPLQLGPAYFS